MMKWMVLCCVAAFVASQEAPKPKCCTPKQWEGYAGVLTDISPMFGKGKLIGRGISLSYDFKNKKIAETVYFHCRRCNKTVAVGLIFDFSKKKMYRFLKSESEKKLCRTRSLKSQLKQFCVPAQAKTMGSYYLGAGSAKLSVTSYGGYSKKFGIAGSITVTSAGCVPISEAIALKRRAADFLTTVGYANITPGIRNPAVFKPPSYCKATNDDYKFYEDAIDEEMDHELDEFVVQYMHDKLME